MKKEVTLRLATVQDAAEVLAIYAHYVEHATSTVEFEVPTVEAFAERIETTLKNFPYYVALVDGKIAGYAYGNYFRPRKGYSWSIETSIYLDEAYKGLGIGKKLYTKLEESLKAQGVLNLIACVTQPNEASTKFHEHMGFVKVGHFNRCAYKLGRWVDVGWFEKEIGSKEGEPKDIVPFPMVAEAVKTNAV